MCFFDFLIKVIKSRKEKKMSVPTKTRSPALYRMDQAAKLVSFEGFFLKPGYYYGYDESGRPIATSTWTVNDRLCLYVKEHGKWVSHWVRESDFRKTYPNYSS